MRTIFVAGAGTDIGKTYVACALIGAWRERGLRVDALKPAASGIDPDRIGDSDAGRLLAALGRDLADATLDALSPFRFEAPLAPHLAARREGRRLVLADLVAPCRRRLATRDVDILLIEGAGGVMSPIAEDGTNLDLIEALDAPVLLVGGSYLGAMSHSLTALETLRARGREVAALVVSESEGGGDLAETVEGVQRFAGGTAVVGLRRGGDGADLAGFVLSPTRSGPAA